MATISDKIVSLEKNRQTLIQACIQSSDPQKNDVKMKHSKSAAKRVLPSSVSSLTKTMNASTFVANNVNKIFLSAASLNNEKSKPETKPSQINQPKQLQQSLPPLPNTSLPKNAGEINNKKTAAVMTKTVLNAQTKHKISLKIIPPKTPTLLSSQSKNNSSNTHPSQSIPFSLPTIPNTQNIPNTPTVPPFASIVTSPVPPIFFVPLSPNKRQVREEPFQTISKPKLLSSQNPMPSLPLTPSYTGEQGNEVTCFSPIDCYAGEAFKGTHPALVK